MTEAEAKRLNENKLTELVDEFKGGNSDAFTGIYDLTKNQLYAYALVLKKNQDAALDLLQETYVKIYRSIDQLNNSDKFLPWAKTILHNSAFSDFRRSKKETLLYSGQEELIEDIRETERESIPEDRLDMQELKDIILTISESLSDEQRATLFAFYYDELKIREIAEIMGCSEGTVKSRLSNGRRLFKSKLEEYEKKHDLKLHGITALLLLGYSAAYSSVAVPAEAASFTYFAGKAGLLKATKSAAAGSAGKLGGGMVLSSVSSKVVAMVIIAALAVGGGFFAVNHSAHRDEAPAKPAATKTASLSKEELGEAYKHKIETDFIKYGVDIDDEYGMVSSGLEALVDDLNSDGTNEVLVRLGKEYTFFYSYSEAEGEVQENMISMNTTMNEMYKDPNGKKLYASCYYGESPVYVEYEGDRNKFKRSEISMKEYGAKVGDCSELQLEEFEDESKLNQYLNDKLGIEIDFEKVAEYVKKHNAAELDLDSVKQFYSKNKTAVENEYGELQYVDQQVFAPTSQFDGSLIVDYYSVNGTGIQFGFPHDSGRRICTVLRGKAKCFINDYTLESWDAEGLVNHLNEENENADAFSSDENGFFIITYFTGYFDDDVEYANCFYKSKDGSFNEDTELFIYFNNDEYRYDLED